MVTTLIAASIFGVGQGSPIELAKKGIQASAEASQKDYTAKMSLFRDLFNTKLLEAETHFQKAGFDLDKTRAQSKDIIERISKAAPRQRSSNPKDLKDETPEWIEAAKLAGQMLAGLNKVAPEWHKDLGDPIAKVFGAGLQYTPTGGWNTNPGQPPEPNDPEPGEAVQPPVESLPVRFDPYNQLLSAPFEDGTSFPPVVNQLGPTVDRRTGRMYVNMVAAFINAQFMTASLHQSFRVPADARVIRAELNFAEGPHWWITMDAIGGYASAEAVVSLRIMDGATVVAEDRHSAIRVVTSVVGYQLVHGVSRRSLRLGCTWTRPVVGLDGTYTIAVVYEGLAGAGGFAAVGNSGGLRLGGVRVRSLR